MKEKVKSCCKKEIVMIFDIRCYGAVGDGNSMNTKAIQAAIDDCYRNGGGSVLVAGGSFVTGTER